MMWLVDLAFLVHLFDFRLIFWLKSLLKDVKRNTDANKSWKVLYIPINIDLNAGNIIGHRHIHAVALKLKFGYRVSDSAWEFSNGSVWLWFEPFNKLFSQRNWMYINLLRISILICYIIRKYIVCFNIEKG